MAVCKEPRRCELQMDNSVVVQILNFKYLGTEIAIYRDIMGKIQ